jgi:hypothetical protein
MICAGILIFALGAAVWSLPASAQTPQERAACSDDAKKLCPDVTPGGGRILDCLGRQKDKTSPACQKVLESHGK